MADRQTLCCSKHSKVGCSRCFDFEKVILGQLQTAGHKLDGRGSQTRSAPSTQPANQGTAQQLHVQRATAAARADEVAQQLVEADVAEKEAVARAKAKKAAKKKERKAKKAASVPVVERDALLYNLERTQLTLGGLRLQSE